MNEQTLFLAALEKEHPEERVAFLNEACTDDPQLRDRVERLLERHQQSAAFIDVPAAEVEFTRAFRPIVEQPGSLIGPYKLRQKIGEGGFGVVYMAEQERPVRRMVALKIIKPGMDTAEVIARFESERQALALMDHPHIARVLDAGATESGRPYFVMELVKGVKITEFCDKNHLNTEARLKLFIDVCHAMQHAHHKGIIHRDVKPSNVMVTLHDGVPVVKVIDFGVAKATVQKLTEKTLFTAYGQMVGTPAYMSPEQAEMSGLDIDTRSDIYSLGVLLYELLTGTTPLEDRRLREAGYAEMQRLIREEEAPRPSTRLSSLGTSATLLAGNRAVDVKRLVQLLSGDLDWVVMKALEKDRDRRYPTPQNFAEDIERYLRRDAILARPPSAAYRFKKFAQRNRSTVITSVAVAAALVLGATVAVWQAYVATRAQQRALADRDDAENARAAEVKERERATVSQQEAVEAQEQAERAREAAEKSSSESAERLVRLQVAAGIQRMEEGDLFAALPPLVEALRLDQGDSERERIHRTRIAAVLRQAPKLVQVWASEQQVTHSEFSPDGRRVLIASDRAVRLQNVATGNEVFPPLVHDQFVSMARFSPDGKRIATSTGVEGEKTPGAVQIWDATIGRKLGEPLAHPAPVIDVAFHPHSGSLATSCGDQEVRVWSAAENESYRETAKRSFGRANPEHVLLDRVWRIEFAPEGQRLLVSHYVGDSNYVAVSLWNPQKGEVAPSIVYYDSGVQQARTDISPDGKYFWAERGVHDAATGSRVHPELPLARNPFVEFSPDSRRMILGDWEAGEAQVWDIQRGAKVGRPLEHRGKLSAVGFSPDGGKVLTASHDGAVRIWDSRTGKPVSPMITHGGSIIQASFNSNGHQVLTVSADRTVRVWDIAVEAPVAPQLYVYKAGQGGGPSGSGRHYFTEEIWMGALWDPLEGRRRLPFLPFGGGGDSWEFNDDESRLITLTNDGKATVWDVQTGRRLFAPLMHAKAVNEAHFLGDGRILTLAQYNSQRYWNTEVQDENGKTRPEYAGADLHVWDGATGKAVLPVMKMPNWVYMLDVSADGKLLATAGGDDNDEKGAVYLWDLATGGLRWRQEVARPLRYVEFSPDGRSLVTAQSDSSGEVLRSEEAAVWDVASGAKKWEFLHEARIAWMGFHPTLPQFLTASDDRTVRRWDYERGEQIGQPLVHPDAVQDAAFIDEGRLVGTATMPGDVRLWDSATGEPVTPWLPRAYYEYASLSIGGSATFLGYLNSVDRPWNVDPAEHSLDHLIALANLLSWGTTPANQQRQRFDANTFLAQWQRLRGQHAEAFTRSPAEILNWRKRELLALSNAFPGSRYSESLGRWHAVAWHADRLFAELPQLGRNWLILRGLAKEMIGDRKQAIADYTTALDMIPRDDAILHQRARLYLALEEYAPAREDLQRAFAIQFAEYEQAMATHSEDDQYSVAELLDSSPVYFDLAMLYLAEGNEAAYRKVCEQLLSMCENGGDRELLGEVAWLGSLSPVAVIDAARVLKMADESAELQEYDAEAVRTLGAALYRSEKYDEAAKRLEEALAKQPEFASAWLLLAMTEHKRGNIDQAKTWLAKATEWIEHERLAKQRPWRDRIFLDALLAEAREAIEK